MIIIETERLILRDMLPEDISERIRFETTETDWQLWDGPWEYEGLSEEEKAAQLKDYIESLRRHIERVSAFDGDRLRRSFQIVEKESGKYLGWVNSYDIDDDCTYTDGEGRLTIGIDLPEPSVWGKGYGTEALTAVIVYFRERGFSEIYTQTWSGNARMIHLAQKLGFREVRRKKNYRFVRGEFYDGLTFCI